METQKSLVLGIYIYKRFRSRLSGKIPYEILVAYLSLKVDPYGRLKQFLEQKFIYVGIFPTFEEYEILDNGTWLGLMGHINRSEVDVGLSPLVMDEENTLVLEFSYPYRITDLTFVTEPPEYVASIFGIFQTIHVSVWLTLASVFIVLGIMYYFILKRESDLRQILFIFLQY